MGRGRYQDIDMWWDSVVNTHRHGSRAHTSRRHGHKQRNSYAGISPLDQLAGDRGPVNNAASKGKGPLSVLDQLEGVGEERVVNYVREKSTRGSVLDALTG